MDYPKNGIAVDLDKDQLPRTLIRCKPDWHAAEVVNPREIDYYTSSRALGELYRNISLKEVEPIEKVTFNRQPLRDPISQVLQGKVEYYIGDLVLPTQDFSEDLKILYQSYREELNYIRSTHTLSNTPGAKLLEAEVVAGTILAKCSQKRWRSDRIYRMRLHMTTQVKEVKNELLRQKEQYEIPELVEGLKKAWRAWEYSQTREFTEEGSNSFGFIALDVILDVLERLESNVQADNAQVTSDPYESSDLSDLESEFQDSVVI